MNIDPNAWHKDVIYVEKLIIKRISVSVRPVIVGCFYLLYCMLLIIQLYYCLC